MSSSGLGEMFEGNFADMCAGKISANFNGGRTEGLACAARTPISVSRSFSLFLIDPVEPKHHYKEIHIFLPPLFLYWKENYECTRDDFLRWTIYMVIIILMIGTNTTQYSRTKLYKYYYINRNYFPHKTFEHLFSLLWHYNWYWVGK